MRNCHVTASNTQQEEGGTCLHQQGEQCSIGSINTDHLYLHLSVCLAVEPPAPPPPEEILISDNEDDAMVRLAQMEEDEVMARRMQVQSL